MKKKIIYIYFYIFFYPCKGQKLVIETESNDIIIINFKKEKDNDIKIINLPLKSYFIDKEKYTIVNTKFNTEIYSKNKLVIFMQRWQNIGYGYGEKYYTFTNNSKDTMNIKCFCPQENNYFFNNLEFHKGNYKLNIEYQKKYNEKEKRYENDIKYVFGNEIKTPKEVQNILFKNAYPWWQENDDFKDLYFRDLKFIKIDLKDTINVKLQKIDNFN